MALVHDGDVHRQGHLESDNEAETSRLTLINNFISNDELFAQAMPYFVDNETGVKFLKDTGAAMCVISKKALSHYKGKIVEEETEPINIKTLTGQTKAKGIKKVTTV